MHTVVKKTYHIMVPALVDKQNTATMGFVLYSLQVEN